MSFELRFNNVSRYFQSNAKSMNYEIVNRQNREFK